MGCSKGQDLHCPSTCPPCAGSCLFLSYTDLNASAIYDSDKQSAHSTPQSNTCEPRLLTQPQPNSAHLQHEHKTAQKAAPSAAERSLCGCESTFAPTKPAAHSQTCPPDSQGGSRNLLQHINTGTRKLQAAVGANRERVGCGQQHVSIFSITIRRAAQCSAVGRWAERGAVPAGQGWHSTGSAGGWTLYPSVAPSPIAHPAGCAVQECT